MSLGTELEPGTQSAIPASTGGAGVPVTPQPEGTAPIAPPAPAAPATPAAPTAPEDFKAKHDRLVTESIPKLQSQLSTTTTRAEKAEADLAALREEVGDVEELRLEIGNERDNAWAEQIQRWFAEGATLKQVAERVRSDMMNANRQRTQNESQKQSVEGLLSIVDGYDKPYATFLRAMNKNGTPITQESVISLRATFDAFKGSGSPTQAAAAASAGEAPPAPKEPPVVPQGGGASRIGDSPVYQPGMRGRDLIKKALAGPFGTSFERPRRD